MSKNSKFKRSQNAHKRLMNKHKKSKNDFNQFVLANYHSAVFHKQKEKGRILDFMEKRKEYRSVEFYYNN